MASTKELFKKGLDYTYTMIVNAEEELIEIEEALSYNPKGRFANRLIEQKRILKDDIFRAKQQMKSDIEYFGYTKADLEGKFKPVRLTQEQMDKDYANDMKEACNDCELSLELAEMIGV